MTDTVITAAPAIAAAIIEFENLSRIMLSSSLCSGSLNGDSHTETGADGSAFKSALIARSCVASRYLLLEKPEKSSGPRASCPHLHDCREKENKGWAGHLRCEGISYLFRQLGNPQITPSLKQKITEGVLREAGNRSVEQLANEENQMLVGLLRLRTHYGSAATTERSTQALRP